MKKIILLVISILMLLVLCCFGTIYYLSINKNKMPKQTSAFSVGQIKISSTTNLYVYILSIDNSGVIILHDKSGLMKSNTEVYHAHSDSDYVIISTISDISLLIDKFISHDKVTSVEYYMNYIKAELLNNKVYSYYINVFTSKFHKYIINTVNSKG